MPDANFAAGLIGSFFDTMGKERARKEQNSLEAAKFLMQTGRVKNYNDLLPFLGPLVGDVKGKGAKGKQDPHSVLAQFVNPALQGGGGAPGGGAPRPGGPAPLFTEDEAQSRDEAAKQRERDAQFEQFQKEEKLRTEGRVAVEEAKPHKGTPDKQASQNADGSWSIKVRDADGKVIFEEPANAPKKTGPLENRVQELIASGVPADRAPAVAAQQLQKERQVRTQQSAQRLNAYLAMSRQSLLSNVERYDEMKQAFPYVLAAKVAGAVAASIRPEALQAALDIKNAGNNKAQIDGQKEAAKIVEAATKQAKMLAGKENSILKGLGLEDDEETIRKNLIQEMSGGLNVEDVEAMAKSRVSGAGGGGEATGTKPTAADRIAARKYLIDKQLPVTDANIKHFLDNQKQPTVH